MENIFIRFDSTQIFSVFYQNFDIMYGNLVFESNISPYKIILI